MMQKDKKARSLMENIRLGMDTSNWLILVISRLNLRSWVKKVFLSTLFPTTYIVRTLYI